MKATIRKEPSQSSCPRPRAAAKKGFRLSSQLLCGLFSAIEVARGFCKRVFFHNVPDLPALSKKSALITGTFWKLVIFSCPEQLNRWPYHSVTHSLRTLLIVIQKTIQLTSDLPDIWSEWWGDMSWPTKRQRQWQRQRQIQQRHLLRIWDFENRQITARNRHDFANIGWIVKLKKLKKESWKKLDCNFPKISNFFENLKIFRKSQNFPKISKLSKNLKIFRKSQQFPRI